MTDDPALVFENDTLDPEAPGTHVLIIGVGRYDYGRGRGESIVGGDLNQLSSPPTSAQEVSDWFISEYEKPATDENPAKPLASLSLLISSESPTPYQPPRPAGAAAVALRDASLPNVEDAARHWAERVGKNRDNMAVFYFCGHGVSLGQKAALLLSDFGDPNTAYKGAIELETLRGTMRNSPAIQQLFLLDCCRTDVDDLFLNESSIGSRILSIGPAGRGHRIPAHQCILFPTLDGEAAFGMRDSVSIFTASFLDAVRFAAADDTTGRWITTTASIFGEIDRLVAYRVPQTLRMRSKPTALDATNFEFNEIAAPSITRSFVTLSDLSVWPPAKISCEETAGAHPHQAKTTTNCTEATCCVFELDWGTWRFSGRLSAEPPHVLAVERTLTRPVAYVKLGVQG